MRSISSIQETIWLSQSIYPESSLYNVGGYALLRGALNTELLVQAIRARLDACDALTIGFRILNEGMLPEADAEGYGLSFFDFSKEKDADTFCGGWMESDMLEAIGSREWPLKMALLQSAGDKCYWYLKAHHLIFDGYSMSLFFNDVAELYTRYSNGAGIGGAKERYLYADFIKDEEEYELSRDFESDRDFWKSRLNIFPEPEAFGSAYRRTSKSALTSMRRQVTIPRQLYSRINLFCEARHCTFFSYFLAALFVLNRKYGNGDAIFGVPLFNRRNRKFKQTLGAFVNTLPIYCSLDEDLPFEDILQRVSDEMKDCYKHQRFGLYNILKTREKKGNIYNVIFSYQKNSYVPGLGDIKGDIHFIPCGEQQEDLLFHLMEYSSDGDLAFAVDFKVDLFSPGAIDNLLSHYLYLLQQFIEQPAIPTKDMNVMGKVERCRLEQEFNGIRVQFSDNKTLVDLFEEQAMKNPERIAVVYGGELITFDDMRKRSGQFANYLKDIYGARGDKIVGVELKRGIWQMIAVLAVMKSGAAYMPVDPGYPRERKDYLLANSQCIALIDEEELNRYRRIAGNYGYECDHLSGMVNNLAYVIYTSGSTGMPKGVLLEHRGVVNRLEWMWNEYAFSERDVILQKTTFTFDVSVWEIFLPLCFGARMVLCKDEDVVSPERISSLVKEHRVTCLHFVPSMLNAFLASLRGEELAERLVSLRMVVTSGEELSPTTAAKWYDAVDIPVHSLYGPTEASVDVTYYEVRRGDERIPIGRPIWNTQMYIVGESMQLLPIGVVGEICIGGEGLARGYLNRPELSGEKFVSNPFREGERMYRTGDLGRWLEDGNIEFLGRKDNQVKVRGYRIELGEIEHVLLQQEKIISAVVVLWESGKDRELVAYVVGEEGLSSGELRQYLGKRLPEYMIPSYYVQMEKLPTTTSGKIDRKSLPSPVGMELGGGEEYVGARDEVERKLVEIWQELLVRDRIGVRDDFFGLGGHSLRATRLVSLIQREFGVKVRLRELFEHPELEAQARLIRESVRMEVRPIDRVAEADSYELSSAQRRLWVQSQIGYASIAYNMPAVLSIEGELNKDALLQSFQSVIARHEILRTVFREDEWGNLRQWVLSMDKYVFSIREVDLRGGIGVEGRLMALLTEELGGSFDLGEAPPLRACLVRTGDESWVLAYSMHHIVSDGWSMDILFQEVKDLYNRYLGKEAFELHPLRVQYKDYSAWQQRKMTDGSIETHGEYWTRQLAPKLPTLDIPADRARPATKSYRGSRVGSIITSGVTRGFRSVCRGQGATLFAGLTAAISTLIYRYTEQEDIIIGTPVAGRMHPALEDQLGCFVNMLPLRIKLGGEESFLEVLSGTKQIILDAYEHQEYPFEEMVRALHLHRDLSRNPMFDLVIVLENRIETTIANSRKMKGVTIRPIEGEFTSGSKFDLTFICREVDDELEVSLEYNTDIFDRSRIERMGRHLSGLLGAIVDSPETCIRALDYLGPDEKKWLLDDHDNMAVAYPGDKTIVQLFEEQVDKTPDRVAVVFGEKEVTYLELNEQANELAHYLRKQYAIKRDDRIGVLLGRSERMVMVLLGVLKSGGAYVPMDPAYPLERIEYMVSDSGCKVVIDERELELFSKNRRAERKENPIAINAPTHLAYVIYTSGTTGRPKGVLIEHRNVVRLFKTSRPLFDFSEQDVWTLFHSYCFDFSVWEMYGALLFGGKLIVVPLEYVRDSFLFLSLLREKKVTILNQTPSSFYNLIAEELKRLDEGLQLRYVIFGGEALRPGKIAGWKMKYPHTGLINMYGITETTVHVTYKEITDQEMICDRSNIGKPIPTLLCYILDQQMNLLPAGISGELYVGGLGVGRGYLNRESLTLERFVENPFRKGERLYRSGDRVVLLENGEMEYLGRMDHQVKVRGYRIELGEIEHVLQSYEAIDLAIVIALSDNAGGVELVAYVTGAGMSVAGLRNYLSERLPSYMIPGRFVHLDKLPLTSNGKVNREELPLPEGIELRTTGLYVAPRNRMESDLAVIWQDVLTLDKVGIRDNFFESGGDSIKVLRLASGIRERLYLAVTIADVYRNNTIETLALHLSAGAAASNPLYVEEVRIKMAVEQEIEALKKRILSSGAISDIDNIEDIYPMSAIEKGMVFESIINSEPGIYHDQMARERVFIDFDRERFSRAVEILVEKHPILRTGFDLYRFEAEVQIVYKKIQVQVRYIDVSLLSSKEAENEIESFLVSERKVPFDISIAPMWKIAVFDLGDDRYSFIFQSHHAIIDGWSDALFMTELNNLYLRLGNDATHKPEKLKSSYRDFVIENEAARKNGAVRDFWKRELAGYSRLDIFLKENKVDISRRRLEKAYIDKMVQLATDLDTSVKVISLSAYLYLLKLLNYDQEVLSGIVINNRPDVGDSDKVLGCFLNTIPMRMIVDGTLECAHFIKNVNNKVREIRDYERLSLIDIAEACNETQANVNLFYDAYFNFVDFHAFGSMEVDSRSHSRKQGELENTASHILTNSYLDFTINNTEKRYSLAITLRRKLKSGLSADDISGLYLSIIRHILDAPHLLLNEGKYLSVEMTQKVLLDLNDTAAEFQRDKSVIDLFELNVKYSPETVALVFEGKEFSFGYLDEEANRVAALLVKTGKVRSGSFVGVMMDRSEWMVIGILGVLKAGAAYVPIDPGYPRERIAFILNDAGVSVVLTDYPNIGPADELQWEIPTFERYICLGPKIVSDLSRIENEAETLWNYVAETSSNAISASGWKNSFTGELFSENEMDELAGNVLEKVKPYIGPDANVLEIGCGSGLIMFKIVPFVQRYTGTDISDKVLAHCRSSANEQGINNIELRRLAASEIGSLENERFDVIIVNSVVQYFPSHGYLRTFLSDCLQLLSVKGVLFIGDIRDKALQMTYYEALYAGCANMHEVIAGKKALEQELFVDKRFLYDYFKGLSYYSEITISEKIGRMENELTRFRYDLTARVSKSEGWEPVEGLLHKYQVMETPLSDEGAFDRIRREAGDAIYLIYTSGSTGRPKGVVVDEKGIVNRIEWMWKELGFSVDDVILQKTTFTFDVSVWEIFLPLCFGARMVLCRKEDSGSPDRISRLIAEQKISCMHFVPSMMNVFNAWMEVHGNASELISLRLIVTSGEALAVETANAWYEVTDVPIYNLYGPTEASVDVTYYEVRRGDERIPIGRPIWNTQMYIVGESMQLLPIGVAGEICIGGEGLARGYLNRPELSGEKFVSNPFREGERMYRTGDLGRWLEDGNIEFLGRKDNQVKVRGYRIELGEIEHVLLQQEKIISAVVVLWESGKDRELVAYVVGEEGLSSGELRQYLGKRLPEYMIPSYYVQMEKLPTTTSGKIDRKSLPSPVGMELGGGEEYVGARDEVERKLVEIWQELLVRDRIGVRDDFFGLGGHSLRATRLVSLIQREFGVKVRLRELFEHPELEAQARLIRESVRMEVRPIDRVAEADSYELSSAQRRLWVLSKFEGGDIAYNVPCLYEIEGDLDAERLVSSFDLLIARHEILRTTFKEDDRGEVFQYVRPATGKEVIIDRIDIGREAGQDLLLRHLVISDAMKPFDLSEGPLLRIKLIRRGGRRWALMLVMHHIVSDGWSMQILLNDLLFFYVLSGKGNDGYPVPLRIQYRDFASWQNLQSSTDEMITHRAYWQRKLSGAPAVMSLPTDFPRSSTKTYKGAVLRSIVGKGEVDRLKSVALQYDMTLFMVLLSIIKILVFKYTEQGDVVIGSPVAGRDHPDLENQIGFYANTLVLRDWIRDEDRIRDVLDKVKDSVMEALEHQTYPFERIVEDLGIGGEIKHNPLFEIMAVLQNASDIGDGTLFDDGELSVRILQADAMTSRFDINFNMQETADALSIILEYNTDLYENTTISLLLSRFEQLIRICCEGQNLPIGEISFEVVFTEEELTADRIS